jgi:Flp pilus assembly pilin Flp
VSERYLQIQNWLQRQEGQDLIEYALLIGLIALLLIVAITAGGSAISSVWSRIASALESVAT